MKFNDLNNLLESGYNWAKGISNNAVDAYNEGLLPASKMLELLKKENKIFKKLTVKMFSEIVPADEWHHTSKKFNKTNFYSIETVNEYKNDLIEFINKFNEYEKLVKEFKKRKIKFIKMESGEDWIPITIAFDKFTNSFNDKALELAKKMIGD